MAMNPRAKASARSARSCWSRGSAPRNLSGTTLLSINIQRCLSREDLRQPVTYSICLYRQIGLSGELCSTAVTPGKAQFRYWDGGIAPLLEYARKFTHSGPGARPGHRMSDDETARHCTDSEKSFGDRRECQGVCVWELRRCPATGSATIYVTVVEAM